MYQAMAAYAAAILSQPDKFMKGRIDEFPVWGISQTGGAVHTNLHRAHKLSILGAMRLASDVLGGGTRAYNSLDKAVRHATATLYEIDDFLCLDQDRAIRVLLTVARH